MNLNSLVGKSVVIQFRYGIMLCAFDIKSKNVAPSMMPAKEGGHQLIPMPFVIGMLRRDDGAESFWVEYDDESKSGATMRLDLPMDAIAAVSSIAKEPSRLIM